MKININQPFHDGGRYHIEISPFICSANQWTGFYRITASVMKGLNVITSLIWDFFLQIAISFLAYVAIFPGQLCFRRSYFFALLQIKYFDATVTFSVQLFLPSSWFFEQLLFQNSHFFAAVRFSEELLFQWN